MVGMQWKNGFFYMVVHEEKVFLNLYKGCTPEGLAKIKKIV